MLMNNLDVNFLHFMPQIKYRAVAVTIATLLSVLVFTVLVPTADVSAALGLSGNRIGRSLITTFSLMTIFYLGACFKFSNVKSETFSFSCLPTGPLATLLHYTSICHEYIVAPDGTLTQRSFIPSLKQYAVGEVFPNFWSEFRRY